MQIDSLKVFCDLAETESFTKAAQINNVTQSAVSQQISALERAFKSLLIERSKKKVIGGAAVGAALGGIFGHNAAGGAAAGAAKAYIVVIPAQTRIKFTLRRDITLSQ